MLALCVRRLAQSVAVLFVMSLLVFAGVYAVGNPMDILVNPQSDQNEIARATAALGLDRPLHEQYFVFIRNAATGDLGRSFAFNVPAIGLILERMPATLELATAAMLIAVLLGIPLGLWAGLKPRSAAGRTIMAGSILGFSLPTFWVGLMLIIEDITSCRTGCGVTVFHYVMAVFMGKCKPFHRVQQQNARRLPKQVRRRIDKPRR